MEEELNSSAKERKELQKKYTQGMPRFDIASDIITQRDQQVDELRRRLKEMATQLEECDSANEKLEKKLLYKTKENSDIESDLRRVMAERDDFLVEIKHLRGSEADSKWDREIRTLKREISELDKENEKLHNQLQNQEELLSENAAKSRDIKSLREINAEYENKIVSLEKRVVHAEQNARQTENDIQQIESSYSRKNKEEVAKLQGAIEDMRRQTHDLELIRVRRSVKAGRTRKAEHNFGRGTTEAPEAAGTHRRQLRRGEADER